MHKVAWLTIVCVLLLAYFGICARDHEMDALRQELQTTKQQVTSLQKTVDRREAQLVPPMSDWGNVHWEGER